MEEEIQQGVLLHLGVFSWAQRFAVKTKQVTNSLKEIGTGTIIWINDLSDGMCT
jgi:hypothetical protein